MVNRCFLTCAWPSSMLCISPIGVLPGPGRRESPQLVCNETTVQRPSNWVQPNSRVGHYDLPKGYRWGSHPAAHTHEHLSQTHRRWILTSRARLRIFSPAGYGPVSNSKAPPLAHLPVTWQPVHVCPWHGSLFNCPGSLTLLGPLPGWTYQLKAVPEFG